MEVVRVELWFERKMMPAEIDLLTAGIGAGGVLLGALVTTGISVLNSFLQRRFDSHIATRGDRLQQYFEAVDTLYEARDALLKFKEANSGLGVVDGKKKSLLPWRNQQYQEYDQQSVDSFERLDRAAESVAVQRARIDVVGSVKAAVEFEKCYDVVFAYLHEVVAQVTDNGKFIFEVWEDHWTRYNAQVERTLKLFRKDLKTRNQ